MHLCKNVFFNRTKHIRMTMTIRKAHLALAAAMAASALISCKKDEDTTTLPYLDGTVSVDFEPALPEYILANDDTEYTMTPKGASHPDGLGVGYQWKVSPSESDSYTVTKEEDEDGDGAFAYNFADYNKDTLRTITVTCQAFADGYSSLSASYYVTVVNYGEKGSIQRAGYDFKNGSSVTDTRDGNKYLCYEAPDNKTWMQQNLAYAGASGEDAIGAPYMDAEAMSNVFGRFYTWNEATGGNAGSDGSAIQGICPDGWHIPSDDEWTELAEATMASVHTSWRDGLEEGETGLRNGEDWSRDGYRISKEFMAGEKLDPSVPDTDEDYDSDINYGKEARSATFNTDRELWPYVNEVGDPTNNSGISAIPAGYARRTNGLWSYNGVFEYAIFWTSSVDEATGKAICRVINNESPVVYKDARDKETFAASVRCVKD